MKSYSSGLIATLAVCQSALSSPTYQTTHEHPSNGICTDYKISNTLNFEELQWAVPPFKNNYDVVDLYSRMANRNPSEFITFTSSPKNVTKTYEIAATFCRPKKGTSGNDTTVLVATHGAGFDKRYWASTYKPEKYSFVYHALEAGYPIFYYDRAGVGASTRTPNYSALPQPQIQLLARMISSIREGKYTDSVKASKVVVVGHSLGSFISTGILSNYPDLVEGAVLTGIAFPNMTDITNILGKSGLTTFGGRLISSLPDSTLPSNADTFDSSYLFFGDRYSYAQAFLHHPQTEEEMAVADYSFRITQPYAVSEFASLGMGGVASPDFKGKVLMTAGQYDLLCGGDCYTTYKYGMQTTGVFTNPDVTVKEFVQAGAGHGTLYQEDNGMYEAVFDFLKTV
ncbi:alpha/beta-hydrolase [Periconia macrospinosa]|uniref:Alpha/beta-hydrolase n=1 Tax=Periconia macrospinosa TaxID=97972 RepID=A0A2V1EBV3_9PLEO|nr:alpha/beta-hydrolase [Periconia macrospinosa]